MTRMTRPARRPSRDPVRWTLREVESPLGPIALAGDGRHLLEIAIGGRGRLRGPLEGAAESDPRAYSLAVSELAEYFAGRRRDFDVPHLTHGTAFEEAVWAAIATIPYGETRSYAEVAAAVGRPGAARAVGQAAGRNPLPILVPCHRVVGADRRLTGYGGGLEAKAHLLALEAAESKENDPSADHPLPSPAPGRPVPSSAEGRAPGSVSRAATGPRPGRRDPLERAVGQAGSPSAPPVSSPRSR